MTPAQKLQAAEKKTVQKLQAAEKKKAQKLQAAEKKKIEKRAAVLARQAVKKAASAEHRAQYAALLAKRAAIRANSYSDIVYAKNYEMDKAADLAWEKKMKAQAQGNQAYQAQQIDEKTIEKRVAVEARKRVNQAAAAARKAQAAAVAAKHAASRAANYMKPDYALERAKDQAWEKKDTKTKIAHLASL